MNTPDRFFYNLYSRLQKKELTTLLILFITCVFTHYYIFSQRLLNEDVLGYTSYGARHISLGRWSEIMIHFVSQSVMFLLVCILLPITAFLAIKICKFSSYILSLLAAIICVVFPTLSHVFGYTPLVSIYCFTLFEAVLAVYFTQKYKHGYLIGAILLGISGGGYQSSIGLSVSLCFCLLFFTLVFDKPLKECFFYALRFLTMGILGIAIYFAGMKKHSFMEPYSIQN